MENIGWDFTRKIMVYSPDPDAFVHWDIKSASALQFCMSTKEYQLNRFHFSVLLD